MIKFQIQLQLIVIITVFNLVTSCLITNCPRGGKRAESDNNLLDSDVVRPDLKSCVPCGPSKQGVCVGRNICCGKHIGCLIAAPHARICRHVRDFKESCLSAFNSCGDEGQCVARDVCCSKNHCRIDETCKTIPFSALENNFVPDILNRLSAFSYDYPLTFPRNLGGNRIAFQPEAIDEILETKEETLLPDLKTSEV